MKLHSMTLGLVVVVLIFGGIGISAALGFWQTESTKIPEKYSAGEIAGEYNPADIRGSYSFGDISKFFEISLDDLGKAFGLESVTDLSNFKCKDMEAFYAEKALNVEIGTNSVRLFVALYKGLPIELADTTYLPDSAVAMLKGKAKLTQEQIAFLDTHSVTLGK